MSIYDIDQKSMNLIGRPVTVLSGPEEGGAVSSIAAVPCGWITAIIESPVGGVAVVYVELVGSGRVVKTTLDRIKFDDRAGSLFREERFRELEERGEHV